LYKSTFGVTVRGFETASEAATKIGGSQAAGLSYSLYLLEARICLDAVFVAVHVIQRCLSELKSVSRTLHWLWLIRVMLAGKNRNRSSGVISHDWCLLQATYISVTA